MRTSISRACTGTAAAAALVLLAGGTAAAHVTVDAPGAQQGKYTVATFRVPDESETASTTALTITIPNLKSVRPEALPGWSVRVEKNDRAEVTAVTWTADAGATGVAPGQFQRFTLSLGPLPKQEKVSFPARQTYSDGKVVNWDQPADDGAEPERPAPTLMLGASKTTADEHGDKGSAEQANKDSEDTDDVARWLGGAGLALGLLGVALGLGTVIRGRRA